MARSTTIGLKLSDDIHGRFIAHARRNGCTFQELYGRVLRMFLEFSRYRSVDDIAAPLHH